MPLTLHVFLYEIHFLQHPPCLFKPSPHVTDTGSSVTHGGRGTRAYCADLMGNSIVRHEESDKLDAFISSVCVKSRNHHLIALSISACLVLHFALLSPVVISWNKLVTPPSLSLSLSLSISLSVQLFWENKYSLRWYGTPCNIYSDRKDSEI